MRQGEAVFVDSGAWIALALNRDPFHTRAAELWTFVLDNGARLFTSIPVVIETFTFLERNTARDVALAWKESLSAVERFEVVPCRLEDLESSWEYFSRRDLHKLSAVDATSFAIMKRRNIRRALSLDHHFASVGFQLVG